MSSIQRIQGPSCKVRPNPCPCSWLDRVERELRRQTFSSCIKFKFKRAPRLHYPENQSAFIFSLPTPAKPSQALKSEKTSSEAVNLHLTFAVLFVSNGRSFSVAASSWSCWLRCARGGMTTIQTTPTLATFPVKSRSRAAAFFTLSQTRSVQRLQAIVKHFTSKFHSNNTA